MANWQSWIYSIQIEARDYVVVVPLNVFTPMEFYVTNGTTIMKAISGKSEMMVTNGQCAMSASNGIVEVETEG